MRKFLLTGMVSIAFLGLQIATTVNTAHGQLRPYRITDNQVRTLLTRIETKTDTFRNQLNNALDASAINGSRNEDQIADYVNQFEQATDRMQERFNSNTLATTDVQEVLSRASYIDSFMRSRRLTTAAQNQWNSLRTDLNTLGTYYRVTWNWNGTNNYPGNTSTYPGNTYPGTTGNYPNNNNRWGRGDAMLTGTYRLNHSASDDVQAAVDRANRTNTNQQGQGQGRGQGLIRRLTPPETLAIQKSNRQVTIASDMAAQAVINADGVARSETSANGRTITTTATVQGNNLNINYEGDRTNDFYVSFIPSGNQLRVTRRVYREASNQTITVTSVYDKISPTADWSIGNTGGYGTGSTNTGGYNNTTGEFIIPNGTRVVGVLDNMLSTKTSADGERFTMKVISPTQYNGAVISGYLSNNERSGRVSGRANMTLNFEQIRLRNGRTYQFAGAATQVRLPNGENVNITNEGVVRDNNQTTKTAVRTGIGAAIGAIIGAVAGGGSGAAIGAGVGAGAGAGSVILQGRDDLQLDSGTEFVITASAPQNVGGLR